MRKQSSIDIGSSALVGQGTVKGYEVGTHRISL